MPRRASRPPRPGRSPGGPVPDAAAAARATLPEAEVAAFDRLARSVPAARAGSLTAEQWLSLHRARRAGGGRGSGGRPGRGSGRPSPHGHAPGALAAPRWQ
ncbi:hypothetical protein [Geodermatophilus marinus]|uniref:hypothetical protein n=1 Tax=Geodermatophilus sp. LHW52908 TaxID=2303986 RepID=UPI000E3D3C03|nr:hypothetical protein [Geodermatophilus sp. LHW52908]RFU21219.1 hypothetical protein D0Z06_12625 [Geodermatophilus sp. LHW52908]